MDFMKGTNYELYNDLVLGPTDMRSYTPGSNSCLDHVCVNNPSNVLTSSVASIGLSDHCPVTVVRKQNGSFAKTNMHKTIRYRYFKTSDERWFTPWSLINMTDDVYRAANQCPVVVDQHDGRRLQSS